MNNPAREIVLIDQLRGESAETPWLEFKSNNSDPEMIGKRCSALSNAARVEGRDMAFMAWGIADGTHEVVGTDVNPDNQKVGNQGLSFWLAGALSPSIAFRFSVVAHPSRSRRSAGDSGSNRRASDISRRTVHTHR